MYKQNRSALWCGLDKVINILTWLVLQWGGRPKKQDLMSTDGSVFLSLQQMAPLLHRSNMHTSALCLSRTYQCGLKVFWKSIIPLNVVAK